ncbi:ABC transporter ATP-binding protein [Neobacillus ginsengisoli]|uniref:ABC transport system ATP-binding protein n=1 Tax=Neobacillus ginsengisoli TaxID=904295 RepID=A0ABT9Y0L2_9BACI|nr:ABC transporter ATP-binding protein [Neobacillus ginsengisoli]MDQ0201136.1 putative ABC transport system ATP-binding protein [Neobacillus ginsengisoli]
MSTPIIQLKNIVKRYKLGGETIHALNDVSLEILKGGFVAIMGPSGSGKSTLMNMIGCLDRPDAGTYLLQEEDIGKKNDNQLAAIRNQEIGFIFQNFNLLTRLTAMENVEMPLLYTKMSMAKRRERALEVLDQVGLKDRAGQLPTQLSGGQQQRVAIARALVAKPTILLADEPTGALDSKTSKEILQVMKELNELGHTVILITHDLSIAKQAGRMVILQDGKLFENGGERLGEFSIH